MVEVISDSLAIKKNLEALKNLICDDGGWISDKASLVAENDDLSIRAKDLDKGAPLIRIARNMLIDMHPVKMHIKNDSFVIDIEDADKMDPVQRKATELTFELYNMTNKVKQHKDYNFWLAMRAFPDTVDAILLGRTISTDYDDLRKKLRAGFQDFDMDDFICDSFIKSRVLGFKDTKSDYTVKAIMTVVDFLNHHAYGAQFNTSNEFSTSGKEKNVTGVSVVCSQPESGSDECFAYYRPMDPMDSLLNYGFVNSSAGFLRSMPVDITIPNYGMISIKSRADLLNKSKLAQPMQDLKFFMPVMTKRHDIMTISHLFVPGPRAPLSMRRVLAATLVNLIGKELDPGFAMPIILDIEDKVLSANIEFFKKLETQAQKDLARAEEEGIPSTSMLKQVRYLAKKQLDTLAQYDDIRKTLRSDRLARLDAA